MGAGVGADNLWVRVELLVGDLVFVLLVDVVNWAASGLEPGQCHGQWLGQSLWTAVVECA